MYKEYIISQLENNYQQPNKNKKNGQNTLRDNSHKGKPK